MLTFIKLLLFLIVVQISPGRTIEVAENGEKLEITRNDTVSKDFFPEFSENVTKPIVPNNKLPPNVIRDMFPSIQRPSSINRNGFTPKIGEKHLVISLEFFNNMTSPGWLRHFQEKLQRIANVFNPPDNLRLNCQDLMARVQEKCHQLFTGPNVSFYGTRPAMNYEFPFAYRNRKS